MTQCSWGTEDNNAFSFYLPFLDTIFSIYDLEDGKEWLVIRESLHCTRVGPRSGIRQEKKERMGWGLKKSPCISPSL